MPKNSKSSTQTDSKDEEIKTTSEGRVSIQYEAFRKMITHTLRFANESKEEDQQVLGLCIGEYFKENKSYIVKDVIPINHGEVVELGFSEDFHEIIEEIKSQYSESTNSIIGWYHSHLGYGLYFSNSDKVNNLNFQNSENPYGFGIVIEQTLLKEDQNFGVEVYRLKDFNKGSENDYIKVEFSIEPTNYI
jgi:proteasome lid subunit RPN8/RPN11